MSEPHVSVYMRITRKAPKLPGVYSTDWNFSKDKPAPFSQQAIAIITVLADFYLNECQMDVGDMMMEIDKVKAYVGNLRYVSSV